ncbi:YybH family protein [Ilyomonas limi]|nr:nuclear transport factor 2 family protein [Ilyomonas limi]
MKLNISRSLCCFSLLILFVLSCTRRQHTKEEIEQAMNNYDSLIVKQDPAAIAQAFTPDGKLGNAATGRENIRQFLSQITRFKVIEQSSVTNNIQIRGDSALQQGTYIQRNVDTKNDTAKAMGNFTCKWKWIDGEGWKIKHIVTTPF